MSSEARSDDRRRAPQARRDAAIIGVNTFQNPAAFDESADDFEMELASDAREGSLFERGRTGNGR